jgi:hypothetical protein
MNSKASFVLPDMEQMYSPRAEEIHPLGVR